MRYISVDEFVNETNGKAYDMDGAYGVQCVDGIKKFNYDVYGKFDFDCGACGYAYGLWTNYGTNGVEKYFDKYPYSEAKKGDWIIWNWGSPEAPKSHVGMFYEIVGNRVKSYGQNQNGIKAFNFCNVSQEGILGVLRPKIYVKPEPTPTGYPFEGIVKKGSPLFDENGNQYPNGASCDRDVTVQGELNDRYQVYGETFNPHIVYANKNDVIKKGTGYPFTAVVKKGSALYDKNGNRYPNSASCDRQVTVQGEYNGRYEIYGETFNPHIVYCDKDAIYI